MQTQANASQSVLADGNSLYTSLSYPDTLEKSHNQITTVNPLINFTCNQMSYPQFSSIIQNMEIENIPTGIRTLEMTNFSHQGLPFDASTRYWVPQNGNSVLNEWIMAENGVLNSNNYPGSSRSCQELSLSLATCQPPTGRCSEMSSWGVTSYSSLHKQPAGSEDTSCSSSRMSFTSYKPVQISSVLHGSRFFHSMQEILAEIACYVLEDFNPSNYSANVATSARSPTVDFPNGLQEHEVEAKKKNLLSLLQVVDEQYNQCMDEIHTVISAFHAVTELDPSLHARFALPKVSLMYKNLRDRISSQILAMGAHFNEGGEAREGSSIETSFIQKQWALHQLKKREHQLWRPQRGLPEKSVSILRAWMFQNFLHPYPKDAEKHLLALKSGLTRSQVSNWFINARVRLWKPLIEEMYAEVNRRKASRNEEEVDGGARRNNMRCDVRRFTVD